MFKESYVNDIAIQNSTAFSQLLDLLQLSKNKDEGASELPALYRLLGDRIQPLLMANSSTSTFTARESPHEETLCDLLEHSDKNKECEKIMLKREMQDYCQKELVSAKENARRQQQQRTLQNRKRKLV